MTTGQIGCSESVSGILSSRCGPGGGCREGVCTNHNTCDPSVSLIYCTKSRGQLLGDNHTVKNMT